MTEEEARRTLEGLRSNAVRPEAIKNIVIGAQQYLEQFPPGEKAPIGELLIEEIKSVLSKPHEGPGDPALYYLFYLGMFLREAGFLVNLDDHQMKQAGKASGQARQGKREWLKAARDRLVEEEGSRNLAKRLFQLPDCPYQSLGGIKNALSKLKK